MDNSRYNKTYREVTSIEESLYLKIIKDNKDQKILVRFRIGKKLLYKTGTNTRKFLKEEKDKISRFQKGRYDEHQLKNCPEIKSAQRESKEILYEDGRGLKWIKTQVLIVNKQ